MQGYITDLLDLRCCDNMELMSHYKDNHFDLAIVDPPYELPKRSGKGAGKLANRKIQEMHQLGWDIAPKKEYFDELFRVSKNQIIWGGNYFGDYLGRTRGILCWDKKQPFENFSAWEFAWTSFDCVARMYRYPTTSVRGKIHPTQKPVGLYQFILKHYANKRDKILDTHLGSGAIALATMEKGLHLTGCEISQDYFDKTIQRIKDNPVQITFP